MRASLLVLMGIAVGCAAGAVALAPSPGVSHAGSRVVVEQYCTDTGEYNDIKAVDDLVGRAGKEGWELVGVYRPNQLGATYADYVCFRRPR